MNVRVSIVLPTLNARRFLDERIASIQNQHYTDWEVIVVDSNSQDGTLERLQKWVSSDSRVRILQAPRGLYACWNRGIAAARGEFVYIATSDDTMTPTFLSTMVATLDAHPSCGIAHCKLVITDDSGRPADGMCWDYFPSSRFFGPVNDRPHIRRAPHDGILHCGVQSVYTSVTQLLIRRRVFEKIGYFETNFGSLADFEWAMKASLVFDTVHVPLPLASWRLHDAQATNLSFFKSPKFFGMMLAMMRSALRTVRKVDPERIEKLKWRDLKRCYVKLRLAAVISAQAGLPSKLVGLISAFVHDPWLVLEILRSRYQHRPFVETDAGIEFCRALLGKYGYDGSIRPYDT